MKSIMLYNHDGCQNHGCEAIVRATSELFASHALARVSLASAQPDYDKSIGLDAIDRVFLYENSPYSVHRLINSIAFRLGATRDSEVARKHHPVISAGKKATVCLSVGGDTYCYGRQEDLLVINRKLERAGKPLVLWGCSIEPDLLQGEMLEDLRRYALIVARESITTQALRAADLPVRQQCDPAFFLRREELPLPQQWREGNTIGINVSPLILKRAKDEGNALDAFKALIRHILETSDSAVALIPHVTWVHDNDLDALGALKAAFEDEARVFVLPGNLGAMQLKGYIARLKALVTARTHASIAGYSTAVPTLVIGYSVKARGIARDLFGREEGHLIPVQELSSGDQLIAAYDAMLCRADGEREYLAQRLPAYTAGMEETIAAVMALGEK